MLQCGVVDNSINNKGSTIKTDTHKSTQEDKEAV